MQWRMFLLLLFLRLDLLVLQVYTLGTILSMQISFVGFQPVQSSEHMAVSAWSVLCLCILLSRLGSLLGKAQVCTVCLQ